VSLVTASLLVSALIGELALRFVLPLPTFTPGADPANQLADLLVAHPTRDYAWRSGFSGSLEGSGRKIRIATNSFGMRDDEPDLAAELVVLAVGDSFTVGFGVEAEDAWPAQLETQLEAERTAKVEVLNAGVSGYGMQQIRLTAEELIPRLEPDLLVVGVYPGAAWRLRNPNIFFEGRLVNSRDVPRLRVTDQGWFYAPYDRPGLRRLHWWAAEHSRLGYLILQGAASLRERLESAAVDAAPADTEASVQALLHQLDVLRARCDRDQTPMVVLLVLPQDEGGGFAGREVALHLVLKEELEVRGVGVADPLPLFQDSEVPLRFEDDHHWTAAAQRLAADAVRELLAGDPRFAFPSEGLSTTARIHGEPDD
jgi:hypothetical protein